ncbi:MAG: 2'-deoxycytidine 5'-triphosphate deaminase [Acidimicrobiia bacterium]|nr:2'-deoxycytidine 5'-triphosphate deaminase [Acidimicrobiia bacterium]
MLRKAIAEGWIQAGSAIPDENVQPASLDLRLGEVAYRLKCSFLPDKRTVASKLADYSMGKLDLTEGAILERNRPYLIPLQERLELPRGYRARANPKSSTGRVDVFTRVITDRSHRFDEIRPGYHGPLFLEVVPLSFTVMVRQGLSLNQLRVMNDRGPVSDSDLRQLHREQPLLLRSGEPVRPNELDLADGLFVGLDLHAGTDPVGYRAKGSAGLIDLSQLDVHDPADFWDPVEPERGGGVILEPGRFYLLLSEEAVRIPRDFAAEMAAYDPTSGELRTHYAGFFDPGFGYDDSGQLRGSRAALEVRAHDVPFFVEHRQRVCRLTFERMLEPPDTLYGEALASNYQGQRMTLSKHFRFDKRPRTGQLQLPYD